MKTRIYLVAAAIIILFVSGINAQNTNESTPDLNVAGFELGNRQKAKDFFAKGYSPRKGDDGRPEYYFYNEFGTEVMKVVGASFDDANFITEIEVFAVGRSYQNKHFYLKDTSYFTTDSDIFIGYRQSIASMLTFPGVTRRDIIGPKDVVKSLGEPATRNAPEKDREVFIYQIPNVKIASEDGDFNYEARYEFYKRKLKRFSLKIVRADENGL